MDPAITQAIARNVGHPGPFRDEELDSIVSLATRHARNISGLERCRSLRLLILSGYGNGRIPDLSQFAALDSLTVSDSYIRDIGAVRTAPALLVLNVERNLISDISPALDCTELVRLDARGNPFSTASYRAILPELRDKGVDVQASEEQEWSLTRALHGMGLPFSYYWSGDHHRLSRPGPTRTETPEARHIAIAPRELEHLLATRPWEIEALFDDPTRVSGTP